MGYLMEGLVLMLTFLLFVVAAPKVPCYFIFGDSLMDNGNNNNLVTQAKANYPPYGIDFPGGHPTGRFSNGQNTADIIAKLLGFETSIPPFAMARREDISRGVNYASGAAGIRDETAQHLGGRISLNQQLKNHGTIVSRLVELIGNGSLARVREHLGKCIYTVGMGNNDYINNYFLPQHYQTSKLYTPDQYAEILVKEYSKQLSTLYMHGARMFGISGSGFIGCAPAIMTRFKTNKCVDEVNRAVLAFNTRLVTALAELQTKLSGAKFIFIDPPLGYSSNFNVTDIPCCKASTTTGEGQCVRDQVPCSARQKFVFWDAFHPTESICREDGERTFKALSAFYSAKDPLKSSISAEAFISDIL